LGTKLQNPSPNTPHPPPPPHSITLLEQIKVWGEKNCGKKSSTKEKFMLMKGQVPKQPYNLIQYDSPSEARNSSK
jgi:hypothetical protein